jgi:hypothetical protein
MSDFHLVGLERGTEEQVLARALASLDEIEAGETVFFSEYLAWTPVGSLEAFGALMTAARRRRCNIVTSLNLAAELIEDLPGHDELARYNAVVVFTRYGSVHVPQANIVPQAFEMSDEMEGGEIGVAPYDRLNRVRLDLDGEIVEVRFVLGSDLWLVTRLEPREMACDLLVVLGNFARGAEERATSLVGTMLAHGVAQTGVHVNAYHNPRRLGAEPLALKVEEVLDSTRARRATKWRKPDALRDAFYVYRDNRASDFEAMCALPSDGRIAVPQSRARAKVRGGEYPITIAL